MTTLSDLITGEQPVMQAHERALDAQDQQDVADEATKAQEYRAQFPGAPPPTEVDYGAMAKDGYDLGAPPYTVPDMYKRPDPTAPMDIINRARMSEGQNIFEMPVEHDNGAWSQIDNMLAASGEGVRNATQEYMRQADAFAQETGQPVPHLDLMGRPTNVVDPGELYLWSRMRDGGDTPTLPHMPGYTPKMNAFADDIVAPMMQWAASYVLGPARLLKGVTKLPEAGEALLRSAVASGLGYNPAEGNVGGTVREAVAKSERVRNALLSIGITDEDLKVLDSTEGGALAGRIKLGVEEGLLGGGFIAGGAGLSFALHTKPAQAIADGIMDVIRDIKGSGDGRAINILQTGSVPNAKISTRVPGALSAAQIAKGVVREDAQADRSLRTGLDVMAKDPASFEKNVNLFKEYPGFEFDPNLPTMEKAKLIVRQIADNLLELYDAIPQTVRERSAKWYRGANKIAKELADKHNLTEEQASGVIAALSPQNDWFMNVHQARRVIETREIGEQRGWVATPAMRDWLEKYSNAAPAKTKPPKVALSPEEAAAKQAVRVEARRALGTMFDKPATTPEEKAYWIRAYDETMNDRGYNMLSPEGEVIGPAMTTKGEADTAAWKNFDSIAKAINIIENGSLDNISSNLGSNHKVRNFYNNIVDPLDPTSLTSDTHAVSAGLGRRLTSSSIEVGHNFGNGKGAAKSDITGARGTYGLLHAGYDLAAKERDIIVNQMQSITWEGVRDGTLEALKKAADAIESVTSKPSAKTAAKATTEKVTETGSNLKENVIYFAYLNFLERALDPEAEGEAPGYEIVDVLDESARKAGITDIPSAEDTIAYLANINLGPA